MKSVTQCTCKRALAPP